MPYLALLRRDGVDHEHLLTTPLAGFCTDGSKSETVRFGFLFCIVGYLRECKRHRLDPECKQRLLIYRLDAGNEPKLI